MKIILKKKCPTCNKKLKTRYKRSLIERIIPKSKKYKCVNCNLLVLKIF